MPAKPRSRIPQPSAPIHACMSPSSYLWVALGGAIGSVGRFWLSGLVARHWGETFPWGTILVNVSGSLVIGFLATLTAPDGRWLAPPGFRLFLLAGLLGGYTTFSSFSLQTLTLLQGGEWWRACANVLCSVLACLAAVWLGHLAALPFNALRGS
jgi:fluoride exporter